MASTSFIQTIRDRDAFMAQLWREGRPTTFTNTVPTGYSTNTHPTVTAGSATYVKEYAVPLGRAWWINDISMSADSACHLMYLSYYLAPGNTNDPLVLGSKCGIVGAGGGVIRWRYDGILPEQTKMVFYQTCPTTTGAFVAISIDGIDFTPDYSWDTKNVICVVGDSIVNSANPGALFTSTGEDLAAFKLTRRMQQRGASVRLVNKGVGGITSAHASARLDSRFYDVDYDLLIVVLGMNDASGSQVSTTDFKTNLRKFVAHRDRQRPNASVILCAPTSTPDTSGHPAIANYRTAVADVVAEYIDQDVWLCDLSTAYGTDANAIATYYSETQAPYIHPNKAGNVAIYNVLGSVVASTEFYARVGLTGSWT